jgi:DNA-directed RNA polymerase specialized sigma24 family protein
MYTDQATLVEAAYGRPQSPEAAPATASVVVLVVPGRTCEEQQMSGAPGTDHSSGEPSFEDFYLLNFERLVRLAFVITGSKEVAEDLVQDSFVRLHGHYHRVESPDRYARQIVVNACKSHFRSRGRERGKRPLLYVLDGSSDPTPTGELADVLAALPYRQRAALVLRFYGDLSEVEIADALGCRPGTVGSLIHRGLERMRKALEE